jgi:hypothetical protein
LKLSFLIIRKWYMRRRILDQKLADMDRRGVWAFTPATLSVVLGNPSENYLRLVMKRLADQGVLVRAARGVYVNPHARSMPDDVRAGLIRFLRPRELTYISLESKLSEVGAISQVSTVLTCMTTGSPGRFDTPWGAIEFTHTDHPITLGTDVQMRGDGVLEATVERSARDLRRVGRNTDLVDGETLAEAIREEKSPT